MKDMDWTFAVISERCAYGVDILAGDVIGSGTVGTGCFLELNGTGKLNNPDYVEQWLQAGDEVIMEIDGLGRLVNTIVKEDTDFSILKLKKKNTFVLFFDFLGFCASRLDKSPIKRKYRPAS